MGISRNGGYSASVTAFIKVGQSCMRLAKTNESRIVLAKPSDVAVPAQMDVDLTVIVDDDIDSRRITLPLGINEGQSSVEYHSSVPF